MIYDYLRSLPEPVETKVIGEVCSIATVAFLVPDNISQRSISENSTALIHNPWVETEGTRADLIATAEQMKPLEDKMLALYAEKTGQTVEVLAAIMAKDTKMTAAEFAALGFATILTPVKAMAFAPKNKQQQQQMSEDLKKAKADANKAKGLLSTIYAFLKGEEPKAMAVTADTGETMYVDGELAAGMVLYTDEAMTTPAAAGTYMVDGKTCVVSDGGVIDSVTDPAAASAEAKALADLKAENEALKAQIAEKDGEVKALADAQAELNTKLTEVQALVKSNFKPQGRQRQVINDPGKQDPAERNRIAEAAERKKEYQPKKTV